MTDAYRRDGGTIQGPHENRLPLSAQAASGKMDDTGTAPDCPERPVTGDKTPRVIGWPAIRHATPAYARTFCVHGHIWTCWFSRHAYSICAETTR
jgi:hypothetical protein